MKPSSTAPRILIVRVGAMGDVLHGMPAVAALRAALPQAHIAWAVEPRWAPLLYADAGHPWQADLPLVHAVHLVEAKAWAKQPFSMETLRSVRALRHALRAERYDVAIDLQGSIRSALITRASGAKKIIGSTTPRETPARMFYTEAVPVTAPHVVDQAAQMISAAVRMRLSAMPASLPVDAAAEAWCDAFLNGRELKGREQRLIFLAPTAGWGAKQWPAEQYGELARELAARGFRVVVNAAPYGVDAVADRVVEGSAGSAIKAACMLPQLIALLRRVRLVVAGDSGPLHLAAALAVPVVAIFGPTDPARNGPYGTRATILRHKESRTDHRRHSSAEAGLMQIDAGEVLAAALALLPPF